MKRTTMITALIAATMILVAGAAPDQDPAATLAQQSEAYCNSTVNDRSTDPKLVMGKVDEAVALLQAEGTAAFPKFQGTGSPFLFEGTYIWVHSLDDCVMLMHPIKYKLVGQNLISMKDTAGKRFFTTMNKVVREQGAGWVEYQWPKPGSDEIMRKVSYVKGCKTADGVNVVVGCGLYKVDKVATAGLSIN
jgi:signal transduction histidine kinase